MGLTIFIVWLVLWILTITLARKRGRSGFGWALLALLISPLLTCVILLGIGDTQVHANEHIEAEERYRNKIRQRMDASQRPVDQPRQPNQQPNGEHNK